MRQEVAATYPPCTARAVSGIGRQLFGTGRTQLGTTLERVPYLILGLGALWLARDATLGPQSRRPTYVALASVSYGPFAIGAPLIGGVLADHFGYPPVFIVSAITGVLAMLAFRFWVPSPRARLPQGQL